MKTRWTKDLKYTLNGLLFVVLFALAATLVANLEVVRALRLSPLLVGIVFGMLYANTLRSHAPKEWGPGIAFAAKTLLRLAIVLYGFRITFQQIAMVGPAGLLVSVLAVSTTFVLGALVGRYVLKLDRDTSLLTASGSAVCGAAAVLATETVLRSEPHKAVVAVSTVVIFGTLSLFAYPVMQNTGFLGLTPTEYGLYTGGTVHEVAQVVGAAKAVGDQAGDSAVIVKMTRVMLLAPLLIALGLVLAWVRPAGRERGGRVKPAVPWFAVLFLASSAVNSTGWIPQPLLEAIVTVDNFLLTMAMTAIGQETGVDKFRKAGLRPFLLALVLYAWLTLGGYWLVRGLGLPAAG